MKNAYRIMLLLVLMTAIRINAQQSMPFLLQKNWYSKQMADVFDDLRKNKLLKVEEKWQDMEKRYGKEKEDYYKEYRTVDKLLYPMWQLSHSMQLNTKDGRLGQTHPLSTPYDPWEAYTILKEVSSDPKMVVFANTFFSEKKIPLSVNDIKTRIEKNLIDTVRVIGTEDAYDRIIDMLFSCQELVSLKAEREIVAFRSAVITEDVEQCEKYILKYKGQNHQHESQITIRRDSLAFVQMDTTVTECQYYLRNFPNSRYKDEVVKRLHRYEFNQLVHTSKACQEYLDKYPNSSYKTRVSEMKAEYAFEEMKAKHDIEAYRTFLADYRHSNYASSHGMIREAQQLLTVAMKSKYISSNTTLDELRNLLVKENHQEAEISSIRWYYNNLRNLPVSSFMNGCEGMTGKVVITYNQQGEEIQEEMVFNEQGLMSIHNHSKTGLSESYYYTFNDAYGFMLTKKNDNNRGHIINYTTKFNNDGSMQEIVGSDGTRIVYSYNGYQLEKITYLRGGTTERIDYYDVRNLVEKSVRSGNTIVYEYNSYGDITSMKKMKGSTTMSVSTYEYEYPDYGLPWFSMSQYNNGNYLLTKTRNYDGFPMNDNVGQSSNNSSSYRNNNVLEEVCEVVEEVPTNTASMADKQIFEVVEQMPSFPGGDAALMAFLSKNIKYPVEAEENNIQGRVVVTFVVECDGAITNVRVVKSADPSLDKEAIRVMKSMPRWKPGKQDGFPVRVKYTTTVTFRLGPTE